MSVQQGWTASVLGCAQAGCGGSVAAPDGSEGYGGNSLLECRECGATYPMLAGVPILVRDPAGWMATYRESVLAALAEVGRADLAAVAVVDAFAQASLGQEVLRFGDDWVPGEGEGPTFQPPPSGPAEDLSAALERASTLGPTRILGDLLGSAAGVTVELGCGSGVLSVMLRQRCERLLVADLSLRAVLRTLGLVAGVPGGAFDGAVVDAEALALQPGTVDQVVAANVVDLLDDPVAFVEGARSALREGGRVLLCTPDPALGIPDDDEERLDRVLEACGFAVEDVVDGVPWLRCHSSRRLELYFVRALTGRAISDE